MLPDCLCKRLYFVSISFSPSLSSINLLQCPLYLFLPIFFYLSGAWSFCNENPSLELPSAWMLSSIAFDLVVCLVVFHCLPSHAVAHISQYTVSSPNQVAITPRSLPYAMHTIRPQSCRFIQPFIHFALFMRCHSEWQGWIYVRYKFE